MKKILCISVIIFSVMSCREDFIEEKSTLNLPIEVAIRNKEDLNIGVNGIYSSLQGEQINDLINFSEIITDNALLSNSNNGQYSEIYNMNYTPNSGKITRFWNAFNDAIIRANFVLSFEGKFPADDGTTNLFSEARIMRAYARLQLANFFCERFGGDNQQLGLVINDTYSATNISETFPRSTVPETYAAIESDLQYAINNMKDIATASDAAFVFSPIVAKGKRFNLLSANLLMSRVQLYKRNYAQSIFFANQSNLLKTADPLIKETSRTDPFTNIDDNNSSSIFQLVFDTASSLGINSLSSYWGLTGNYKQFFATKEFYDLIPATDGRRLTTMYQLFTDNIYDTPKPYYARKIGRADINDVILVRNAEIDFNIIESTYYTDPTAARTLLVNWVRANRDPAYNSTSTGAAVLDDILNQRRIEFAFEGYRFIDLKRNDIGWTKGAHYTGNRRTITINDKEQCLPIPLVEITVNPKMVQNPGY